MAQFWGRIDGYRAGATATATSATGRATGRSRSSPTCRSPTPSRLARRSRTSGPATAAIALAICGDGATSNGRWHEAINISAIHRLPVVWVVNNNQFAVLDAEPARVLRPDDRRARRRVRHPGVRVDGGDVLEVYEAAKEAVERARSGGGPSLIESVSLRWRGHAGHDPAKYVPPEMLEDYIANHDPVKNFEEYLLSEGVVNKEDIEARSRSGSRRSSTRGTTSRRRRPSPRPATSRRASGSRTATGTPSRARRRDGGG